MKAPEKIYIETPKRISFRTWYKGTQFIVDPVEYILTKKNHELAQHINRLRDIAEQYGQTQQLREHIRSEVMRFNGREE